MIMKPLEIQFVILIRTKKYINLYHYITIHFADQVISLLIPSILISCLHLLVFYIKDLKWSKSELFPKLGFITTLSMLSFAKFTQF